MADMVYILINEAMPGYVKIGITRTSVEQRMRDLDTTAMPLPFECFHAAEVIDGAKVEKLLHDGFRDRRVRKRREFFEVDPEQARSMLLLAQIKDVTPREEVVGDTPEDAAEDIKALGKARTRRGRSNFNLLQIPPDSVLTFSKDDAIICTVVDDKKVEFEGEITSLSNSALTIFHRLGFKSQSVAGTDYWQFEGETLVARRLRIEQEMSE